MIKPWSDDDKRATLPASIGIGLAVATLGRGIGSAFMASRRSSVQYFGEDRPGSPGFVYVRSDHHATLAQPIAGWFGHRDMFAFDAGYDADQSIRRFMVGTPAIVSMAGTQAGIEITARAGMEAIAGKATELTGLFIDGLAPLLGAGGLDLITPRDPARRGSHVAVRHDDGYRLSQALRAASVIVDFRAPDIVRFGFAPLYTTFAEVAAAVGIMEDLITSGSFRTGSATRRGVT